MESNENISLRPDVAETSGESAPRSLLEDAFTAEQIAALQLEVDIVPQEAVSAIQPLLEDTADIAGRSGSEHKDVHVAATATTLGTLFAESGEESAAQATPVAGEVDGKYSFWDSHPTMRKLALAGTAALSLLGAPQTASAGGHSLRDQVRAELQLQAGTAANNALNGVLQIGVNRLAQVVGVPPPQPVFGPQVGVVIGIGGLPPGIIQPGQVEAGSDIRAVRAGEVGNFEQALAAHQGLATRYYAEMTSYYQSYQATGSKGDGDMYLQKRKLYESELGQVRAAEASLAAAKRNMVNGR